MALLIKADNHCLCASMLDDACFVSVKQRKIAHIIIWELNVYVEYTLCMSCEHLKCLWIVVDDWRTLLLFFVHCVFAALYFKIFIFFFNIFSFCAEEFSMCTFFFIELKIALDSIKHFNFIITSVQFSSFKN